MRQLTSLDALFLAVEDGKTHGHVSSLGIYDPTTVTGRRLDAALVRELVAERLHLLPPFRWRLARVPLDLDYPYWVDQSALELDLELHVCELALPTPGEDRQLAEKIARIIARPLDRARPLWEIHVVHGLADGGVAILTKMHHAAVDGVSGAEVMSVLLDTDATGRTIPDHDALDVARHPHDVEMLGRGLLGVVRHPLRALPSLPRALPHLDQVPTLRPLPGIKSTAQVSRRLQQLLTASGDQAPQHGNNCVAPRTRFQAIVSADRRVAFGSVSLADVKAVKAHYGCTVNDVVVTICAAALRSWLDERGELPAQPLVAMVPASVRTPEQLGTYGNRVSAMLAQLPTDEPDPIERLRRVSAAISAAKQRHRKLPVSLLDDANHLLPPAVLMRTASTTLRLAATSGMPPAFNLAISNVAGSPTTLYCNGAAQRAQYPISGVLHGDGLNVTVVSYRDALGIGIVADREQLDDAWPLLDGIRKALDELCDLAQLDRDTPDVTKE